MKGLEETEEDIILEKQLAQELSAAMTFLVLGHLKLLKIVHTYFIKEVFKND